MMLRRFRKLKGKRVKLAEGCDFVAMVGIGDAEGCFALRNEGWLRRSLGKWWLNLLV